MEVLKAAAFELIRKSLESRKVAALAGVTVLNLVVVLFTRFGITLDESAKQAIESAAYQVTNAVIVFIVSQAGVDIAKTVKGKT